MVKLLDVYDDLDDYQKHIKELNKRLDPKYNPKPVNLSWLFEEKEIRRPIREEGD